METRILENHIQFLIKNLQKEYKKYKSLSKTSKFETSQAYYDGVSTEIRYEIIQLQIIYAMLPVHYEKTNQYKIHPVNNDNTVHSHVNTQINK